MYTFVVLVSVTNVLWVSTFMKDILGVEIKVGDLIIYNYSRGGWSFASVIDVEPWRIRVCGERDRKSYLKHSSILVISSPDLIRNVIGLLK